MNAEVGPSANPHDASAYHALSRFNLPPSVYLDVQAERSLKRRAKSLLISALLSLSVSEKLLRIFLGNRAIAIDIIGWMLKVTSDRGFNLFVAKGSGYQPEVESVVRPTRLVGYFQSYRYVSEITDAGFSLACVSPSPWLQELDLLASNCPPIIVHLRLGDYREEKSFGIPGLEYFRIAFETVRVRAPEAPVWLFSDEPESCLGFMPPNIVRAEPRIICPPTGSSPADILEAMRLGNSYILCNSTFGYWGAMLSRGTNKIVIVPKPWFKSAEEPADLIPPDWLRIGANHL